MRIDRPPFLYHGSDEKLDVLLPHQAGDSKYEEGCHLGAYGTSNRDVALAFALGGVPDEAGTCSRVMRRSDPDYPKMIFLRGRPNLGGKGYLYKVLSTGFRHVGGDQWVCDHAVRPVSVTEISVDDYPHLFRYATEQERTDTEREFRERIRWCE